MCINCFSYQILILIFLYFFVVRECHTFKHFSVNIPIFPLFGTISCNYLFFSGNVMSSKQYARVNFMKKQINCQL